MKVYFLTIFQLFILLLAFPGISWAEVRPLINLDPTSGRVEDVFQLAVSIEGQQGGKLSRPKFEPSSDFTIESTGSSTSRQYINGVESYQVTFTFRVIPRRDLSAGEYELPKGSMRVDGVQVELNLPKLEITHEPSAGSEPTTSPGMAFTQLVDNERPYVGQQILYRAELASTYSFNRATIEDLKIAGFLREPLNKGQERVRSVGNTSIHSVMESLFPLRAGKVQIPGRALVAEVVVPRSRPTRQGRSRWSVFDDVFSDLGALGGFETTPRKLLTQPIDIEVKELPSPPVGVSGYIPVGKLSARSTIDQLTIKQGESVTLTIVLNGDANLRPYELPSPTGEHLGDFKIYVDKPSLEVTQARDRVEFQKVFKVAFVPLRSGSLRLPTYSISYFDPKEERYETTLTQAYTLEVTPDLNQKTPVGVATEPVKQPAPLEPKEVNIVGEDILPQHVGPHTLVATRVLPAWLFWLAIVLAPTLTILFSYRVKQKRDALTDPAAVRQRSAKARAISALRALQAAPGPEWPTNALAHLRNYFGDRFRTSGESLTSIDAATIVQTKLGGDNLAKQTEAVFSSLQKIVYGGGTGQADETIAKVLSLIEEIDRNAN